MERSLRRHPNNKNKAGREGLKMRANTLHSSATNNNDRSSKKNSLVCFQLLSQSLYELGFEKTESQDAYSSNISYTDAHTNSRVGGGIKSYQGSTSTPKRRRKENGKGSRIRFSPEKKHHLRDTISHAGSLLDEPLVSAAAVHSSKEEDDQSILVGAKIALHHQFDDLSYSDSDASPVVARNLTNELRWENLEEIGADDGKLGGQSICNSTRLDTSLQQNDSLEIIGSPCESQERTLNLHCRQSEPCTTATTMVGEVVAVAVQPPICPRTFQAAGRQVSECSDLTMEGLVPEESPSTPSTSPDEESEIESYSGQWSSYSSSSSQGSLDSGIRSTGEGSSLSLHRPYRNNQVVEAAQNSLHWMWYTDQCERMQSSPIDQKQRNRSGGRSNKRRPRTSHCARKTGSKANPSSFLFPFQSLSESFETREIPTIVDEGDDGETSILVDLTEDLKEIAIMAGKSSESLVANIFHQLCEETKG